MAVFECNDKEFLLDGKPFWVRSGAIHYFRVPPFYWENRLKKLAECGFNTVETYIAWNIHEKEEGVFDFSGERDFGKFFDIANSLGLKVIVRPGPFICAEWEMGGLPAWLLRYPNIVLRSRDPVFLEKTERYISAISEMLRPRLIKNGGNIIMLQLENEYGSYGNDKEYLQALQNIYKKYGLDDFIITADGASFSMLNAGMANGCLPTLTFGSKVEERIGLLRDFLPRMPLMCTEFWAGWFDHWYEEHHIRPVEEITGEVTTFLENRYNFNFYMFHGGTNFAFYNGANFFVPDGVHPDNGTYQPVVTSYDYNALLNEAGDRTPAYFQVRKLMEKFIGKTLPLTADDSVKKSYGKVEFSEIAELFDNLKVFSNSRKSLLPISMEQMGQNYGYILYSSQIGPSPDAELRIASLADRANIFIDGKPVGIYERGRPYAAIRTAIENRAKIDILVENMGRVNYGSYMKDSKGIAGVKVWEQQLFGWQTTSLPMEDELDNLVYKTVSECEITCCPAFYRGQFSVSGAEDTFLKLDGFKKGFVLVNKHNIGRYYNAAGPQKTLYVPKCFLKEGENEIIVFDSDGADSLLAEFVDKPQL